MKLTILTTGGTIEKTYSERDGTLRNRHPVLDEILDSLRLPDLFVRSQSVMNKDSLDLTDDDRRTIVSVAKEAVASSDAIVIIHGTDTLELTGDLLFRELMPGLEIPLVLTGAMRPYEFRDSDALQNVTEALLAYRLLAPGVYVAMHNRVLRFPGVQKDRSTLTFINRQSR